MSEQKKLVRKQYLWALVGTLVLAGAVNFTDGSGQTTGLQGKLSPKQAQPSSQVDKPSVPEVTFTKPNLTVSKPNLDPESGTFLALAKQADLMTYEFGQYRQNKKSDIFWNYCDFVTSDENTGMASSATESAQQCYDRLSQSGGSVRGFIRYTLDKRSPDILKGFAQWISDNQPIREAIMKANEENVVADFATAVVNLVKIGVDRTQTAIQRVADGVDKILTEAVVRDAIKSTRIYAQLSEAEMRNKIRDVLSQQPIAGAIEQLVKFIDDNLEIDNRLISAKHDITLVLAQELVRNNLNQINEADVFKNTIEGIVKYVDDAVGLDDRLSQGFKTARDQMAASVLWNTMAEAELAAKYSVNRFADYNIANLKVYINTLQTLRQEVVTGLKTGQEALTLAYNRRTPLIAAQFAVVLGDDVRVLDDYLFTIVDLDSALQYLSVTDPNNMQKPVQDLKNLKQKINGIKSTDIPAKVKMAGAAAEGLNPDNINQPKMEMARKMQEVKRELDQLTREINRLVK